MAKEMLNLMSIIMFIVSMQHIGYVLDNSRVNRSQAKNICSEKYSGFLPYSDNYNDKGKLKQFMKENNIHKCWLGLEKKTYSTPRWIDSSVVGECILF